MIVEDDVSYQRNRLRTLDGAFIWLVSLFSLLINIINAVLGGSYIIALLPMLIPIFVIPICEGLVTGSVLRDSLAWRARGWVTFLVVVLAAT